VWHLVIGGVGGGGGDARGGFWMKQHGGGAHGVCSNSGAVTA